MIEEGQDINRRHRYRGVVDGGRCAAVGEGGAVCGLGFFASLHYTDTDHPYTDRTDWFDNGDKGQGCGWLLQQLGTEGPVYCGEKTPTLHAFEPPTEVLEGPILGDVPEGAWSPAEMAAALGGGAVAEATEKELPFAARAAWALRNDDVVVTGPWPVRQWYAMDGGAAEWWENPGALIAALNVAGEPFRVETWWADPSRRMVRVTWGAALMWSDEEVCAMVESWPA